MRPSFILVALALLPGRALAQASVASDLWRIAAGTQTVPLALSEGGTASLWTPAVGLADHERFRFGAEAINSPAEVGVSGGLLAFSTLVPRLGVVSIGYGRLSVDDVTLTETSPEAIGSLAVYNQAVSIGLSRDVMPGLLGGIALRYLSGELGPVSRSQLGVDFGIRYRTQHLTLGGATRFFDPTLRAAAGATSYSAGAAYRSSAFEAWGTQARVLLRYGVTAVRAESAEHLVTAGVALGESLALDAGASLERAGGDQVVRSRFAIGLGSGPFWLQIGRDGGVNGFGAAYRFGLTGMFR